MTEGLLHWLRSSPWPARGATLAALLLAAAAFARLGWSVLAGNPAPLTSMPTLFNPGPPLAPPRAPISGYHLFGVVGSGSTASVPNAPETQLNLALLGVIGGRTPQDGIAIIADLAGRQDKYLVGQTVGESGAVLEEVHSDRVILRFNGRQETLKRFKPAPVRTAPGSPMMSTSAATMAPPAPIIQSPPPADPSGGFVGQVAIPAQFEMIRQQALADPAALLSQVQVVPVLEGGQLRGVRLGYSGDPALLAAAGLQPDDVIVSVNGMRIDSIERGMQVVETLRNAPSISVTVRRGGAELPLPPINLR